jgi:hypothetical protein
MSTQLPSRTATRQRAHRLLALAITGAWLVTLAPGAAAQSPAPADGSPTPVSAETAAGVPIPISSLGDLTSLEAEVTLSAAGSLQGKEMSGDLNVQLLGDEQQQYRIDITGDLLGPIAAQVGGRLVGLFRPKRVSVYVVEDGNYIVVSGLTDVCVRTEDTATTEALSQLSPRTLMEILTNADVARGQLVGTEPLNDRPADHYTMDGAAFLAAAQASGDPTVQAFGQALRSASDADLFVDVESGYPVRYEGAFSGAYEPVGLDGDFSVRIDLTKVGTDATVTLPKACDRAISM